LEGKPILDNKMKGGQYGNLLRRLSDS